MSITIIPWIVVLVFGGIFVFAAIREILRHRAHGPPDNPRDAFEFDENAPSYEEPDVPETPEKEKEQDNHGDGADGVEIGPDDEPAPNPAESDRDTYRRDAGADDQEPPDRPDRNEVPK